MTNFIDWITSFANKDTGLLGPSIAAAIVSAIVSYFFGWFQLRDKLATEYKHEQRKQLRELIGRYHGRLMFAATNLNNRMWNLYKNAYKDWQALSLEAPDQPGYYLASLIHRFLTLQAFMRQIEVQAIVLDRRIADPNDYNFLKYVRLLHWTMTDAALFQGLEYDNSEAKDHFFSDKLREYSDELIVGETVMTLPQFCENLKQSPSLHPVVQFFSGICPDEDRLRWDRIVALHLVLLAFLNSFGVDLDYSEEYQFANAAARLNHPEVLVNLVHWIGRHKLDGDPSARRITALRLAKRTGH